MAFKATSALALRDGDMSDALYELIFQRFVSAAEGGARTPQEIIAAVGVDQTAFRIGIQAFIEMFGSAPEHEQPGLVFSLVYALGHAEGIRRAAIAAAAPAARGREADLFGLLLAGQSVDAALARIRARAPNPPAATGDAKVVELRPRGER